jgi:hypothetical protein
MSDYFQVKIVSDLHAEGKEQMEQLGLSDDYWVIRNAMWCEDYLDCDREDIEHHVAQNQVAGRDAKMVISDNSEDCILVEVIVREVPPLVRQGNSNKGYILHDDIAEQMATEIRDIGEEGIPPGSGEACNWFRAELERFNAGGN